MMLKQKDIITHQPSHIQRFFERYELAGAHYDPCWFWTGAMSSASSSRSHPVPIFAFSGHQIPARRWLWVLLTQNSIGRADHIKVACKQPRCIAPAHLRRSNMAENLPHVQLKRAKQGAREAAGRLLGPEDILKIGEYWIHGYSTKVIADKMGVSEATVTKTIRGDMYGDLPIGFTRPKHIAKGRARRG